MSDLDSVSGLVGKLGCVKSWVLIKKGRQLLCKELSRRGSLAFRLISAVHAQRLSSVPSFSWALHPRLIHAVHPETEWLSRTAHTKTVSGSKPEIDLCCVPQD